MDSNQLIVGIRVKGHPEWGGVIIKQNSNQFFIFPTDRPTIQVFLKAEIKKIPLRQNTLHCILLILDFNKTCIVARNAGKIVVLKPSSFNLFCFIRDKSVRLRTQYKEDSLHNRRLCPFGYNLSRDQWRCSSTETVAVTFNHLSGSHHYT